MTPIAPALPDDLRELDHLPVGVVHADATGTVLRANKMMSEMLGLATADAVGRHLLEFAVGEVDRYASMLEFGTGYVDGLMGPVAVQYVGADGRVHTSALWTMNALGVEGVDALVMVFVPEQSTDGIAAALSKVAEDAPIDETLELLAASLHGNPFVAQGCWLVDDADGRRLVGADELSESVRIALSKPGPWWRSLRAGSLVTIDDVHSVADEHHRLLHAAGVGAWWLQPLPSTTDAGIDAGLLVLRNGPGPISPNQVEHLEQMVTIAGLAFDRTAMQARLTHAAYHDPLTGAGNRERFFDEPTRLGDGWALLYIDLDEFKPVNDRFGHAAGDLVLVTVTERLRNAVRPTDRVTRMGGDEFVIECAGVSTDADAAAVARRIIEAVQRPIGIEGTAVNVGASIGIVRAAPGQTVDLLLERADQALYEAKLAGRGCWKLAP